MIYTTADESKRNESSELFAEIFGDDKTGTDLFYKYFFNPHKTYIAVENKKIVSQLFMLPCSIVTPDGICACNYLYAAGTKTEFRGKGIMEKLINFAISSEYNKKIKYTALLPAEKGLYDYYARFGFKAVFKISRQSFTKSELAGIKNDKITLENYSFDNAAQLRFNIYKDKYGAVLWDPEAFENALRYMEHYKAELLCFDGGYALYVKQKDKINIYELITQKTAVSLIAGFIAQRYNADSVTVNLMSAKDDKNIMNHGMLYGVDDNLEWAVDALPYLGLTME